MRKLKDSNLQHVVLETTALPIELNSHLYLAEVVGLEPTHRFIGYLLFSGQLPYQLGLYFQNFTGGKGLNLYIAVFIMRTAALSN